jgi:hypothetical protein
MNPAIPNRSSTAAYRLADRLLDRLNSSHNVAFVLLQKEPDSIPRNLKARIHALPQELQDEIGRFTILAARRHLHWISFSILEACRKASPPLSNLQQLKLWQLVHQSTKMFRTSCDVDYATSLSNIVRIFAVHRTSSVFFLEHLHQRLPLCSLLEAAAILRLIMLAQESAELTSTVLTSKDIPEFVYKRFKSITELDRSLCIADTPTLLTKIVPQEFGGLPISISLVQQPHIDDWYITMKDSKGQCTAIISIEGGRSYTWVKSSARRYWPWTWSTHSFGTGEWHFTTHPPAVKNIDRSGARGIVEWQVEGRAPIHVEYEHRNGMVFDRYWFKFDPQGALSAYARRKR